MRGAGRIDVDAIGGVIGLTMHPGECITVSNDGTRPITIVGQALLPGHVTEYCQIDGVDTEWPRP